MASKCLLSLAPFLELTLELTLELSLEFSLELTLELLFELSLELSLELPLELLLEPPRTPWTLKNAARTHFLLRKGTDERTHRQYCNF